MNTISVARPWGSFTQFTHNEPTTVKLLYVKKGEGTSLQYHTHRQEFWKIIIGNPELVIGEETHHPSPGDEFTIPENTLHRISAPTEDIVLMEISRGHFDEEDIVRIEDKYDRVPPKE